MKTLLIGFDGATFTILDSLMADGTMPFLKQMADRGVRAELLSTPNPLTPPAWTSLATGRSPGNHGIFDFLRPEETEDGIFVKLLDSRDIQCETIWSIASRQERRIVSLNFPVMFPPQPVAGCLVPGFVSWRHLRRAIYPRELYDDLKELPGFNAREIAWDMDKEQKAVQTLPEDEYEDWIRYHIRREQQWFEILRYIMQKRPYDLMGVVFDGVDKLQHLCWHLLDPELTPTTLSAWEKRIRSLCRDYFRTLDGFLADIVKMGGQESRSFIVSDHGFGPTWDIFYLNVWLQQHGYLQWSAKGASVADSQDMFGDGLSAQRFDWDKTRAYALTPSSNGIYIRKAKDPDEPGVPPGEYESFRNELMTSLLAFTDPGSGEPIVQRIMKREEVFPGKQMHLAPDLTLVLRDQGFISVVNADSPLKRRKTAKGMHRPEGIFVAAGTGIRQGCTIAPLSILDICPLLVHSLDLKIPEDLEKRLAVEIFEPSFLRAFPAQIGRPTVTPRLDEEQQSEPLLSKEEEETVLSQLRALGYIE
jgi:predicted AlkP superfamily phosphohydrolase/phosphomutase